MSDHNPIGHCEVQIRQLRSFIALAEELNFTRAARRMNITQPPFSQQISQLEEALEVKLFRRNTRRVELTDAGHVFLQDIRDILRRLDKSVSQVRIMEEGLSGHIEVGLAGAHFRGPIPRIIAHYNKHFPNIAIVLNEMRPTEQIQALLERKIDVSISRVPISTSTLRHVFLWPDPVMVALPKAHALSVCSVLRLEDLVSEPLIILRRETSPIAQQCYERIMQIDSNACFVQVVEDVPAQISLVSTGLGVAIVPLSTTTGDEQIEVRPLVQSDIRTDVYGVVRVDADKPHISIFLDECRKFAKNNQKGLIHTC